MPDEKEKKKNEEKKPEVNTEVSIGMINETQVVYTHNNTEVNALYAAQKKKFIAVTCHYDILERLEPDWVFDTKDFTFTQGVKLPNTKDLQLNAKSGIEV